MVGRRANNLLILGVLLLSSCEKDQLDDCFTSAGPMRIEERSIGDFRKVELHDRIDLVLEERAAGTLSVEAGRNLLDQVETEVREGVLIISDRNTCNWVRSFKPRITVRIPMDRAGSFILKGTGNVSATSTVRRGEFRIEQGGGQGTARINLDVDTCVAGLHSGAGNVVYTGRAGLAFLYSASMGPIDASGLEAARVLVNNSGVTDIHCRATQELDAQIYNAGNIYYSGSPLITSQLLGSGQFIQVE